MPITIVSPGVEVYENDLSLRGVIPTGTNITIPVFAQQGPTGEVISISTASEFEDIFGLPTNSAELYGWATVTQAVNSAGKISVIRLPYGAGSGDTKSPSFTVLAYPAKGFALSGTDDAPAYTAITKFTEGSTVSTTDKDYTGTATFLIGEPVQFTINIEEYYNFIAGRSLDGLNDFTWDETIPTTTPTSASDLGKFAFLVFNVDKTVTNEGYEGFYLGLSDNAFSDPSATYRAITSLKTVTKLQTKGLGLTSDDFLSVPAERLDFELSSEHKGCISQIMQESINSFDISANKWNDTLNLGVFKIRQSTSGGDALKLAALMTTGYNASIQSGRKSTSSSTITAVDSFIENVSVTKGGINVFVNPHLSGAISSRGLFPSSDPKIKVRVYSQQLIDTVEKLSNFTSFKDAFNHPCGITKAALDTLTTTTTDNDSGTTTTTVHLRPADALYPIGLYSQSNNATKIIGNIPAKVKDALAIVVNNELFDVDVVLEGGMGTIYVGAMDAAYTAYHNSTNEDGEYTGTEELTVDEQTGEYLNSAMIFDDSKIITGVTDMRTSKSSISEAAEKVITNFKAVQSAFLTLATSQSGGGRGDTIFIGDGLRHISVEGKDTKVEKKYKLPFTVNEEASAHSFSTSIYWPHRHLFSGLATSYMAAYPHFIKVQHPTASRQFWAPASGFVASKLAETDAKVGPWQAAAGLTNGVLTGALDVSFNTTQRQRDDLYKISLNPIIKSPDSIQLHGIRTMIRTASSFDQITVRRLFLYINKLLRNTAKQFLFEGNTDFTRLRVIQTLKPIFDDLVTKRALYDYLLVCDTRNNTPQIIDDGILQIDFYGSGTRTAERIGIGVTATRYGANLTELVG